MISAQQFTGERPHQLTTLIVGDSIIRNVRTTSAKTCFPGATVRDVADKATEVLANDPGITKVIVHTGTIDIRKHQPEIYLVIVLFPLQHLLTRMNQ